MNKKIGIARASQGFLNLNLRIVKASQGLLNFFFSTPARGQKKSGVKQNSGLKRVDESTQVMGVVRVIRPLKMLSADMVDGLIRN